MLSIKMKFGLRLDSEPIPYFKAQGPLFHEFLPDGESDAVFLTPEGDPHEIRVWFDRTVKNLGGFLCWNLNGKDFDEAIMRRQSKLEGGYLRGEMVMPGVSQEEQLSLYRNPKVPGEPFGQETGADPIYATLGKRVIDKLHPRLANFIATLRDQYGQYWLPVPPAWDSRHDTLGTYCSGTLNLLWWSEKTHDWRRFLPTDSGSTDTVERLPGRGYAEYLTQTDWRRLQENRCLNEVSTELQLLGNANRALDFGEYRQAFIEVMSAFELVIARRLASSSSTVESAIQSFMNRESQRAQVAVLLLATGAANAEIEQALLALAVRNRVAHEGYRPSPSETEALRGVIQTIKRLAGIDEIKSPVVTLSNELAPLAKKST
jgi:hypothetical protein